MRPSRGGGVVRASAVSELTERVTFFFFSITNLELSIISIKLKRFFVIDRYNLMYWNVSKCRRNRLTGARSNDRCSYV